MMWLLRRLNEFFHPMCYVRTIEPVDDDYWSGRIVHYEWRQDSMWQRLKLLVRG